MEIRLARVEPCWFLDIVSDGRISSETSAELAWAQSALKIGAERLRESAEKLQEATKEICRLEREMTKVMQGAQKIGDQQGMLEEQRRMDRREIRHLRRDLAKAQGLRYKEEPEDVQPLNALDLIAAINQMNDSRRSA